MMTLEEAIIHCNEKACDNSICALEHKQLAEWLEELKKIKESLKLQNNVTDKELAQAKKDAYNDALDKIEYYSGEPTFDDGWNSAIWYLKKRNAQFQITWKPSDEQMKAIKLARSFVTDDFDEHPTLSEILIELEAQLKKLREE